MNFTASSSNFPMAIATPVIPAKYVADSSSSKKMGQNPDTTAQRYMENTLELTDSDRASLLYQGYPTGLIESMMVSTEVFPLRIWVVDNSGSMNTADGHRIVHHTSRSHVRLVDCTRWAELKQTVEYHIEIASVTKAPTVFRLLNNPGCGEGFQRFSIGERGAEHIIEDVANANKVISTVPPTGCTPLSEHIREIRSTVMSMLPQLQDSGKRVAIILATDGIPTDSKGCASDQTKWEFEKELRSLVGLPIWMVIRLCTDEDSVVNYYNDLDSQLELNLDILDDWEGEAKEVHDCNPWLTYGLCLHRMREMGFHHRLFDLLDERQFTLDEIHEFLGLLLGTSALDGAPDPNADLSGFLKHVDSALLREKTQWNPLKHKMTSWVNTKKIKALSAHKLKQTVSTKPTYYYQRMKFTTTDFPVTVATSFEASKTMDEVSTSLELSCTSGLRDTDKTYLLNQGFPTGLIDSMMISTEVFPLRIWVVDNSTSMKTSDGHLITQHTPNSPVQLKDCTRWSELKQTVVYHMNIAGITKAPTAFRLLNDPKLAAGSQYFSIGERGAEFVQEEVMSGNTIMAKASPIGCTPLSAHIREIRNTVMSMLPQLQNSGKRVAIILATDGLPTDNWGHSNDRTRKEFENELRSLVGLPIWMVIRLCTDEDSVVNYYNDLDSQLELNLDILDDWEGEAKEVHDCNPWLTYGLCLHRMREMGFHHRLFDLLDERQFTLDEIHEFLGLLLGTSALDGAPDPNADLSGFLKHVDSALLREKTQWNPLKHKMTSWVSTKKIKALFRRRRFFFV
eukprot:Nitzschia sp. Nitz4//scaffold33_size148984//77866//81653//NITZ4_002931-RA/size148984-snap-gene-0.26-mRNA-1//-1//CDS//3329548436//1002//frame0